MIKTYASITDLANDAEKGAQNIRQDRRNQSADLTWYNNETLEDTLSFCRHGNPHLVPAAEKLIDLFDAEADIEMPRKTWQNRPAGMFPDVPAYLMGQSCTMKALVEEPDEHAPISLLVISTSSAGVKAATLQKRGACILALTLLLARRRPLSLQTVSILDGADASGETVFATRIETAPLDLAVACYALSSSGFDRRINHFLGRKHNGYRHSWPKNYKYHSDKNEYYQYLIDNLSPNPERTLLIPSSQLNDELLNTPVTWLKTQVARFIEERTENGNTL